MMIQSTCGTLHSFQVQDTPVGIRQQAWLEGNRDRGCLESGQTWHVDACKSEACHVPALLIVPPLRPPSVTTHLTCQPPCPSPHAPPPSPLQLRRLLEQDRYASALEVRKRKDHFIFTIESTGILPPEQLLSQALDILQAKAARLADKL